MLDNQVQNMIALQPDGRNVSCAVLLDFNILDDFLEWLKDNPDFERSLREDRSYRIGILKRHAIHHSKWKDYKEERRIITGLQKQLPYQNIQLLEYDPQKDSKLVDEIHHAYFGGDLIGRNSAELLAYGRRHSNGKPVRVISHHRGFRISPQTVLYFLKTDDPDDIGGDDNASYLRAFTALNLHDKVASAALKRVINGDHPTAIVETVKTLFGEVQQIVRTTDPELARLDGYQLIHQAFDCAPEERKKDGTMKPERPPKIKLNNLDKDSEWSEQKGFRDLGCGAASAIRNPISHTAADKEFIQSRFGDRRTALKFLCLLSLLFEKLDKRVAPR